MRAQLVPLKGGRPIEITKDVIVVGRKKGCDLRLAHKAVSKYHCIVVKTSGLLLLRDLGSTNGTRVNGQKVRRAALLPNDRLKIAGFQFRVHLGPDVSADDQYTQPLEPHEFPQAENSGNGSVHDEDVSSDMDFDKINLLLDSDFDRDN